MYQLKIGDLAKLGGVSTVTLRYYDEKGVLTPEYTDSDTGYRYYTVRQLMQLSLIQYMRSLGFCTEKIKGILETDDENSIYQALLLRQTQIGTELEALTRQKSAIAQILDGYTLLRDHPACGKPFLQTIPERYLFVYHADSAFDEPGYSQSYEQNIIEMMHEMTRLGIFSTGYINIGCIVERDYAAQNRAKSSMLFSRVEARFAGRPGVVRVGERICICNLCEEPENELRYMKMLYEESARRGMVAGDYSREEIIFYPHMSDGRRSGLYLQAIPVTLE